MSKPPAWLDGANIDALDFPGYLGRTLDLQHVPLRLVRVGGDKIEHVTVQHPARVTRDDLARSDSVIVDWVDHTGAVQRRGHPDNLPFTAPFKPTDVLMPRNGDVEFAQPDVTDEIISCRHLATALDRRHSESRQPPDVSSIRQQQRSVPHVGLDYSSMSHFGDARVGQTLPARIGAAATHAVPSGHERLNRHAEFARAHFKDRASVQSTVPFSDEARFRKLFAVSRNASIVQPDALGEWAAEQFKGIRLGASRTFLIDSIQHVMHITLAVDRREDGRRAYTMVLQDPNRLAKPSAVETSRLTDVRRWTMGHVLDETERIDYFNRPEDGLVENSALIIETPRGVAKQRFEEGPSVSPFPPAEIDYFPRAYRHKAVDLSHFALLGHGQERIFETMASASPREMTTALDISGLAMRNMKDGDPAAVARHISLVKQLFRQGLIGTADVAKAVQTGPAAYSLMEAVKAARPEVVRHYLDGIAALIQEGALTYSESTYFDHLYDPSFEVVLAEASSSGDQKKIEAASLFHDVRRLATHLENTRPIGRRASFDMATPIRANASPTTDIAARRSSLS